MKKWEKDLELRIQLDNSFKNTCILSESIASLSKAVKHSIDEQQIILETQPITVPLAAAHKGDVIISKKRMLESAYAYKGKKIAVLNFASALCPCNNILHTMEYEQEQCLLRESTLYSCISTKECMEQFYEPHKALNYWYNADMIYTPDVKVFKRVFYGKIPELMQETEWFNVDVITMAPPKLSTSQYENEERLLKVFTERFIRIMSEAAIHNVDILILDAFGCGEAGNDPIIVATAVARALDKFRKEFDTVEFAIYETGKKKNYRVFRLVLDRYINNL